MIHTPTRSQADHQPGAPVPALRPATPPHPVVTPAAGYRAGSGIDTTRPPARGEPLAWRDDWLLGIDLLDTAHREMVRRINRLADATEQAPLAQRVGSLIDLLREHFATEQHFLRTIEYPGLDAHAREHALQMAEFVDLKRSLANSHARVLAERDMQSIKHWFFNHVIAEDRRFAAYYHEVVCGEVACA